jgi:uridine kinase
VTARNLARALVDVGVTSDVLHQDNYFVRPPRANHAFRCLDLSHVGPHEVQLGVLAQHIDDFRAGRDDVAAPLVDYARDQFVQQRHYFGQLRLLIVEGTYALTLPGLDFRIFLEATHVETQERRRVRNRDLDEPVIDEILTIEHRIIAPQRLAADVIIDRDFRIATGQT